MSGSGEGASNRYKHVEAANPWISMDDDEATHLALVGNRPHRRAQFPDDKLYVGVYDFNDDRNDTPDEERLRMIKKDRAGIYKFCNSGDHGGTSRWGGASPQPDQMEVELATLRLNRTPVEAYLVEDNGALKKLERKPAYP
ncbi:MAG: hypothetical protein M1831_004687 [Alyxoria varia]|nr:MAG: hypothetical protein M1831_004687 [Alyxoria varia]